MEKKAEYRVALRRGIEIKQSDLRKAFSQIGFDENHEAKISFEYGDFSNLTSDAITITIAQEAKYSTNPDIRKLAEDEEE